MRRRTLVPALIAAPLLPRAARAQSASALEVGVLPNLSARVLLAQYQPMRDFLARDMQRAVQVSTAPDWAVFHRRTLALEYDLLVTAAHLARLAQLDRGWRPLLSYAPKVRALLVVTKVGAPGAVGDLKGQAIVLSNPQSLVALRAMQWLDENGLQRERDFKTIRTSADDSVGNVLLRGDAVAAICSGGEFRAIPEAVRSQLAVHTTFAEVASFVVMASPRLAARDAQDVKQSLLRFAAGTDEGKAFFSATGFSGLGEVEPGTMESMDAYVETTRRLL
ncbi:MAG TPA: PhnD/SsuA/transferrin family substrate-binding protein [Burkholderiaceae bacterium]|nr:PhnD/SsuA/transferrin family substrate-binding protein [Burkholderiaceae bacterium]